MKKCYFLNIGSSDFVFWTNHERTSRKDLEKIANLLANHLNFTIQNMNNEVDWLKKYIHLCKTEEGWHKLGRTNEEYLLVSTMDEHWNAGTFRDGRCTEFTL